VQIAAPDGAAFVEDFCSFLRNMEIHQICSEKMNVSPQKSA